MPIRLPNAKELLNTLLSAVDKSGWQALVFSVDKPFRLRLFRENSKSFDVRIYIWNCTHGGGKARPQDEWRVQLTGVVPNSVEHEQTLLLGWHSGYEVFVGFNLEKHDGQASKSPSIQIKEVTLQNAHLHAFATYQRQNGEIAVAFRPEMLVEYALSARELHLTGTAVQDISLLNDLEHLTEDQILLITDPERKIVVSQIVRRYRAADFRKRVLGAYSNRCAVCGIQLELIDAAHIVPVVDSTSTDETNNGIALCKLHHAAFDRNLISFDEDYRIELSQSKIDVLSIQNLSAGANEFQQNLRPMLILPNDRRDFPAPAYIARAREIRGWIS
jgi:putative restriction endonuclease